MKAVRDRDFITGFKMTYCKVCNKNNVLAGSHTHDTPDPIPSDADYWDHNEDVFVFGSNDLGHHGGGAAKAARLYYGAVMGQARGLQGSSYAIVTISFQNDPNIGLNSIGDELDGFIKFANDNPTNRFWMTKIGTGISQIPMLEIQNMFIKRKFPDNVILPKGFK